METKKLKNRGNNLSFRGEGRGNLKFKDLRFKDSKIQNSKFKIQNSKETKSNCNILWFRDDDL